MKFTVRLIALLLAAILVLGIVPLAALAEEVPVPVTTVTATAVCYSSDMTVLYGAYGTKSYAAESVTVNNNTFGNYITFNGYVYELKGFMENGNWIGPATFADGGTHTVSVIYVPHTHHYTARYNRTYHWDGCNCGSKLNYAKHVDPASDEDSICTCGYKFSNNADLSTLWLTNMVMQPRFNKAVTEYSATIRTYKQVTSTQITAKTYDALATVTLPTDLSIHEGMNVFEFVVTAEDGKTTKTYTVYACLPTKADGIEVTSTRTNGVNSTIAAPKAKALNRIASFTLTETIAEAMAAQVKMNESTQIVLEPSFSRWYNDTLRVTVPSAAMETIAESKADLVIKTWMGTVTVPNSEVKTIAGKGESIELAVIFNDGPLKCSVFADGNELDNSKLVIQ